MSTRDQHHVTRHLARILLFVFWLLLWWRVDGATVLSGLVLAGLLVRPRRGEVGGRLRPLAALRAIGHVLVQVVVANATVLREVLRREHPVPEGIVEVELATTTRGVDVLVGLAVTLTPGTVVLGIDRRTESEPSVLRVHTLTLTDPARLRRDIARFEELFVAAVGASMPVTEGAQA